MGEMFVSHQLVLGVSFQAAQARLENLTQGGWLSTASGGAYADGVAAMIRVGAFGDVPGASKLVKVSLLEPVPRDDAMVLSLRWEATGLTRWAVSCAGRRPDRDAWRCRADADEAGRRLPAAAGRRRRWA